MSSKLYQPTEHDEQVALMTLVAHYMGRWPELGMLYAVPNGGQRSKAVAGKLRAEGVKPGVPDLCLPVPRGQHHGLYIELKRKDGGEVSKAQAGWLKALEHHGYKAVVCHGAEDAMEVIVEYMRLPVPGLGNARPEVAA